MGTAKCWAFAAATALILGCSTTRERVRPAPTPLFESNVRTDEVSDGPVETGRPELNTAPVPARAHLSDANANTEKSTTLTVPPDKTSQEPAAPPGTMNGQQVRQRICDDLRRGARMEVEETDNGARLWLYPTSRADAVRLRKTADELSATTAASDTTPVSATPCALYQLVASGADLRVAVLEDGAIRIDVRAPERESRGHVRAQVERFAGKSP